MATGAGLVPALVGHPQGTMHIQVIGKEKGLHDFM